MLARRPPSCAALLVVLCLAGSTSSLAQAPPGSPATSSSSPIVRVEFRERMESAAGVGYTAGRDDVFWLSRVRVTVTGQPAAWIRVTGQAQDARVAGKDVGSAGTPFSAPLDIRLAHVVLGRATSPVALTVGRQELVLGEQRLVGHVNWANAARSFDGVRLTGRRPGLQLDAFTTSVVRIRPDEWDRGGFGSRFHGLHLSTTRLLARTVVEPYLLWRQDDNLRTETGVPGDLSLGSAGLRIAGQVAGGFDYASETVLQWGALGPETQRARAQHIRLRTPARGPGIRLTTEYNYASGDRAAGDGRRGTFDPLYPTPHDKYGLADQVGWRNVHHLRAAVDVPVAGLPLTAAYHSWWLASATDALYNAPGAVVARSATGVTDRHVGHGVDLQTARALTSRLHGAAGYAVVHPGAFLRATTPAATLHAVYMMLTVDVTLARRSPSPN